MNVEELLDEMDELLDKAWNLPLAGGRSVVDVEKVRDMLDSIRLNLPTEIRQAKAIVSDRADIISSAKKEAEILVRKAEERAKILISQDEITKAASAKAAEIMSVTTKQSREMRQNARDFSDVLMRRVEEAMLKTLNDVKVARQALKTNGTQDDQR